MEVSDTYVMRGQPVAPLSDNQIFQVARVAINQLLLYKLFGKGKDITGLFDKWAEFGLTVDIVDDDEWLFVTNGHFDPATFTIRIPNRVLVLIQSKQKRDRKRGLKTLLHELGHFCLAHKAVLNDYDCVPCKEVDSEEQADTFADCIINYFENGVIAKQLCLF